MSRNGGETASAAARDPDGGRARRPEVRWHDLGRRAYAEVWSLQRRRVEERKRGEGVDRLLLVEHEPVITLGRRARTEHVKLSAEQLAARGVATHEVERGGDVTYHGPGQLVAYPILNLRDHRKDVRWYSTTLLEVVVRVLGQFGIAAEARQGPATGVWVRADGPDGPYPAKIAALGVRIERWITYHGIAINVDPNLDHFDWIVPCGLPEARTTSMARVLGTEIPLEAVSAAFRAAFAEAFDVRLVADEMQRPDRSPTPTGSPDPQHPDRAVEGSEDTPERAAVDRHAQRAVPPSQPTERTS